MEKIESKMKNEKSRRLQAAGRCRAGPPIHRHSDAVCLRTEDGPRSQASVRDSHSGPFGLFIYRYFRLFAIQNQNSLRTQTSMTAEKSARSGPSGRTGRQFRSMFLVHCSLFAVYCSLPGVRCSIFCVRCSVLSFLFTPPPHRPIPTTPSPHHPHHSIAMAISSSASACQPHLGQKLAPIGRS